MSSARSQMVVPPLEPEVARGLLAKWLTDRRGDPAVAASVRNWLTHLAPSAPFWKNSGEAVVRTLVERLATVVRWAELLGPEAANEPSTSPLGDWWRQVAPLRATWSPSGGDAWQATFLLASGPAHRLLRAVLAQALAVGLEQARLPRPQTTGLVDLLRHDQQACAAWPLPPATGRSWEPEQYLFPTVNRAYWSELVGSVAEVERLVAEAQRTLDRREALPSEVSQLSSMVRELANTSKEVTKSLGLVSRGWPQVTEVWQAKFGVFVSVARQAADATRRARFGEGGNWGDRLSVALEAAERVAAGLRAGDPDSPSASVPDKDAASAAEKEDGGTGGEPLRQLLKRLAGTEDERGRSLAERLSPWVGTASAEASRQLLACLTYLDDLVCGERRPVEWMSEARRVLRDVVERDGTFIVLDRQLLGRPVGAVGRFAEAVGFLATDTVREGEIARIEQPGYALQNGASAGDVLRRARVLIARSAQT